MLMLSFLFTLQFVCSILFFTSSTDHVVVTHHPRSPVRLPGAPLHTGPARCTYRPDVVQRRQLMWPQWEYDADNQVRREDFKKKNEWEDRCVKNEADSRWGTWSCI